MAVLHCPSPVFCIALHSPNPMLAQPPTCADLHSLHLLVTCFPPLFSPFSLISSCSMFFPHHLFHASIYFPMSHSHAWHWTPIHWPLMLLFFWAFWTMWCLCILSLHQILLDCASHFSGIPHVWPQTPLWYSRWLNSLLPLSILRPIWTLGGDLLTLR